MATILPTGETTFLDANGSPLAGGTVTFYIPGTTTPKDTWQNSGQSILNSNPVTLDSGGRAVIYGSGSYRQVVQDSLGNIIWDQQTSEPNAGSVSFGGTSAGTTNAQTLSAAQFGFLDGQIISFVAGITNTGTMTISVGGGSPIPILKNGVGGPVNLVAGDITAGNSYFIQYSAALASFQLLLSVAPALPTGTFLSGYLFGLTLSNDAGDVVNNIGITTGLAASDGATPVLMTLSSVLVKKANVSWQVGTNQGGLDTGSIGNGTYHVFLIQRSDTGVVDALFSLSPTTPTMPANYDRKRRIGAVIREVGALVAFNQEGDVFKRFNTQVYSGGFTSVTPIAMSVPTGKRIQPLFNGFLSVNPSTDAFINMFDGLDPTGSNPTGLVRISSSASGGIVSAFGLNTGGLFTNTSGQLNIAVQGSGSLSIVSLATLGWIDTRGRLA